MLPVDMIYSWVVMLLYAGASCAIFNITYAFARLPTVTMVEKGLIHDKLCAYNIYLGKSAQETIFQVVQ